MTMKPMAPLSTTPASRKTSSFCGVASRLSFIWATYMAKSASTVVARVIERRMFSIPSRATVRIVPSTGVTTL